MIWRSMIRIDTVLGSWKKLSGGLGAAIFAVSDTVIIHSMTCPNAVAYSHEVIHATYYLAQLLSNYLAHTLAVP